MRWGGERGVSGCLSGTRKWAGLAHENGNEGHTFHKSCKKDGNGKNLTEGSRIAADGFGGFHANDTNADTGTENSQTGLGDSAHSGGVCEHVNHGVLVGVCCFMLSLWFHVLLHDQPQRRGLVGFCLFFLATDLGLEENGRKHEEYECLYETDDNFQSHEGEHGQPTMGSHLF